MKIDRRRGLGRRSVEGRLSVRPPGTGGPPPRAAHPSFSARFFLFPVEVSESARTRIDLNIGRFGGESPGLLAASVEPREAAARPRDSYRRLGGGSGMSAVPRPGPNVEPVAEESSSPLRPYLSSGRGKRTNGVNDTSRVRAAARQTDLAAPRHDRHTRTRYTYDQRPTTDGPRTGLDAGPGRLPSPPRFT